MNNLTNSQIVISRAKNGWIVAFPEQPDNPVKDQIEAMIKAAKAMKSEDSILDKAKEQGNEILNNFTKPVELTVAAQTLYIFVTFDELLKFLSDCNSNEWLI